MSNPAVRSKFCLVSGRIPWQSRAAVTISIQIDKTLAAIGQAPTESKRLLLKIYAALAEGLMIGMEKTDEAAIRATASSISDRTKEIESLI